MEVKALFPTVIGVTTAAPEQMKIIRDEVLERRAALERMLRLSWGDNVLSSFDQEKNVFAAAGLNALQEFIESSILDFTRQTRENSNLTIVKDYTQSWMNVTKKWGYQERHNHERSVVGLPLSGVYYLSGQEGMGELSICPGDAQYKFFGDYSIEPEEGKLVLFRSEVFHRVGPNMTDVDRVSFSFNYLLINA